MSNPTDFQELLTRYGVEDVYSLVEYPCKLLIIKELYVIISLVLLPADRSTIMTNRESRKEHMATPVMSPGTTDEVVSRVSLKADLLNEVPFAVLVTALCLAIFLPETWHGIANGALFLVAIYAGYRVISGTPSHA